MPWSGIIFKKFLVGFENLVSNDNVKFSEKNLFGALSLPTAFLNMNKRCFANVWRGGGTCIPLLLSLFCVILTEIC